MRIKGKITSWDNDKGFGFISPKDGGKQVFVHIKAFSHRKKQDETNQVVTYSVSKDKDGRVYADKVRRAGDRRSKIWALVNRSKSMIAVFLFFIIVATSALIGKTPFIVLYLYLAASLVTFVIYALDKSAAKKGTWRTQESTLHLLSLAGGWPGAIVAQQKLRHKSKKQNFRIIFWITVLLNIGIFVWWHTPTGGNALRAVINGVMWVIATVSSWL